MELNSKKYKCGDLNKKREKERLDEIREELNEHNRTIFTNGAQPEGGLDVGCNEGLI